MEDRGEHEADPRLGEASLDTGGIEGDRDAELLEQIRRPAQTGGGAVAVLRDRNPRARHDDRGQGRDVERAAPVTAGAAGVEHRRRRRDRVRELERRAGEPVELVDGLPLRPQGHQEATDLRRGHVARHDRAHHLGGGVGRERLVRREPLEGTGPEIGVGVAHEGAHASMRDPLG
jgi:hypothetical protein